MQECISIFYEYVISLILMITSHDINFTKMTLYVHGGSEFRTIIFGVLMISTDETLSVDPES
jgi:hypothetical protein